MYDPLSLEAQLEREEENPYELDPIEMYGEPKEENYYSGGF